MFLEDRNDLGDKWGSLYWVLNVFFLRFAYPGYKWGENLDYLDTKFMDEAYIIEWRGT